MLIVHQGTAGSKQQCTLYCNSSMLLLTEGEPAIRCIDAIFSACVLYAVHSFAPAIALTWLEQA